MDHSVSTTFKETHNNNSVTQIPVFTDSGPVQFGANGVGGSNAELFSAETAELFNTVNLAIICTPLCCFGICTNIANIVVFSKQGFQDSINLTLCALAVSDLLFLVCLLWRAICNNPYFLSADLPFIASQVQALTAGWPMLIFSRITGWLTAYLTVERCLCVLFPLKVKAIITKPRAKGIIAAVYIVSTIGVMPAIITSEFSWKFVAERNTSLLGTIYRSRDMLRKSFLVSGIVWPLIYAFLVMTSTAVLAVTLLRQARWRQKMASSEDKGNLMVSKDLVVIKMVVCLAGIFLVCLLVPSLINIPSTFVAEFSYRGKYRHLMTILVSFCTVLTAINSGVNIFVYYSMSTKFRLLFREIFLKYAKK